MDNSVEANGEMCDVRGGAEVELAVHAQGEGEVALLEALGLVGEGGELDLALLVRPGADWDDRHLAGFALAARVLR